MKHVLETEAYHDGYRHTNPWSKCVIAWKDVYSIERDPALKPMNCLGYDGQASGAKRWTPGEATMVHLRGVDGPMIVRKAYVEVVQEFEHYLAMIERLHVELA